MRTFVLDTGALIALQRDRGRLRTLLELVTEYGYELRTSAPVLTEFLGGSPPRLRRAGDYVCARVRIGEVDETIARRAATLRQGAMKASPGTAPSAIDALVSTEAERHGGVLIIDGDRADHEALAGVARAYVLKDLAEIL